MRVPFGKRGLIATTAIVGAVVYWRVRQSRERDDREWIEDIDAAIDEGTVAGERARRDRDEV